MEERIYDRLFGQHIFIAVTVAMTAHILTSSTANAYLTHNVYLEDTEESFFNDAIKSNYDLDVNINSLLADYYTICPFDGDPRFPECPECRTDINCIRDDICCPHVIYGYLGLTDVNVAIFPENRTFNYKVIGHCPEAYKRSSHNITRQCSSVISPCTSNVTQVIYRNKMCASCHLYDTGWCEEWEMGFDCNITIHAQMAGEVMSFSDLDKLAEKYNCGVSYKRPHFFREAPMFTVDNGKLIDRCNASGFLRDFDPSIDWACRFYNRRYKQFKNVYCYICNPSAANVHMHAIAETGWNNPCEGTIGFESLIELCSSASNVSRVYPRRNIFCKICSDTLDGKRNFVTEDFTVEVTETVTVTEPTVNEASISSRLSFLVSFDESGSETTLNALKAFFERYLTDFIQEDLELVKQESTNLTNNDSSGYNIQAVEEIYASVCGAHSTCLNPALGNRWGNPVCGDCSCKTNCFELGNCCVPLYFVKNVLSCYSEEQFLSYTMKDYQGSPRIRASGSSYRVLSKCLVNQIMNPEHKIIRSIPANSPLLRVPLITREGLVYENALKYVCYSTSPIRVNFQFHCDTYIEIPLFLSWNDILSVAKKRCHALSFVPLNGTSCLRKYDPKTAAYLEGPRYERVRRHPSTFPPSKTLTYLGSLTELTEVLTDVYDSCNITGLWQGHAYANIIIDICERQDESILVIPEYEIGMNTYKNFACFLCNPDNAPVAEDQAISSCDSTDVWHEPNTYLEDMCSNGSYTPRHSPYKNVYCSECNLPPLQKIIVRWNLNPESDEPTLRYLACL